jgi:hypothetical protein
MKIYFGDANDDLFSDGLFMVNEDQYYYGVEHGTGAGGMDEISIFDGCKRSVPLHIEAIPALIAALQEIQKINEAVNEANRLTERAESDAEGHVYQIWGNDYEVAFDSE